MAAPDAPSLAAIFLRFLRFGALAWGGPAAQIAMLKRELVDEERWLAPERFNRLLGVFQLLPGPEAHELCVHLGMMRRGRVGGLLAGVGFMLPGLVLMLILAAAYARLDLVRPPWPGLLLGVQVAVVALIVRAVHRIGEHALAQWWLAAIALASAAAALLIGGQILPEAAPSNGVPTGAGALLLFATGLKAGLLTFGGAYTAIPFVRGDSVGRGWLTDGQFLDGLALTSLIPAPLVMFATFVGFQAGGIGGALAITAGIFLPAFAFSLLGFEHLERIVDEPRIHRLLEGLAAAVVGLIAATAIQLAAGLAGKAPSQVAAAAIFAAALALLYLSRSKLAVPAVIALSAAAGALTLQ